MKLTLDGCSKEKVDELIFFWLRNHDKDYLASREDLDYHLGEVRKRFQNRLILTSIITTLILAVILFLVLHAGESLSLQRAAIVAGSIFAIVYFFCYENCPIGGEEVHESLQALKKDWKKLSRLDRSGSPDATLRQMGRRVSELQRLRDNTGSNIARKQFVETHRLLYAFSLVTNGDYGEWIDNITVVDIDPSEPEPA